jgi:hypothetical protein
MVISGTSARAGIVSDARCVVEPLSGLPGRAMQERWDSIITTRAALQGSAMALLIATLISS